MARSIEAVDVYALCAVVEDSYIGIACAFNLRSVEVDVAYCIRSTGSISGFNRDDRITRRSDAREPMNRGKR
jgi:hypothetical protein